MSSLPLQGDPLPVSQNTQSESRAGSSVSSANSPAGSTAAGNEAPPRSPLELRSHHRLCESRMWYVTTRTWGPCTCAHEAAADRVGQESW